MTLLVGLALGAVVLGAAGTASSATLTWKLLATDAREGGTLDFRSVSGSVGPRPRVGRESGFCSIKLKTWGAWNLKLLKGHGYTPGRNKLEVLYDLNGNGKADLAGYVISGNPGGAALLITSSQGEFIPANVHRPGVSSLDVKACEFLHDPYLTVTGVKSVRVAFVSVVGSRKDRMPNRGWITLLG